MWGVSLRNSSSRPGVEPFILALTASTVACNEMLHDGAGRASQVAGRMGVDGLPPPVPPSQVRWAARFCSVRIGSFSRVFFFLSASRCRDFCWRINQKITESRTSFPTKDR